MNDSRSLCTEIFHTMDYGEETEDSSDDHSRQDYDPISAGRQLLKDMKVTKESQSYDEAINGALQGQEAWKALSVQLRVSTLHKIWDLLRSTSRSFPHLKNEFSLFIDYFDFYCDILLQIEKYVDKRPQGIILIVLSNDSIFFPLAATVPAALAAGCSVIVVAPKKLQSFLLLLQDIFSKARLPDGVFSTVVSTDTISKSSLKRVDKIFFCAPYSSVQKFYKSIFSESFNFFCPNNTAAFILESADFDSAVDKIISETWGKEDPVFAVSTVVIQESVYQEVFDKLKYKINQFMSKNKHSLKFKDETVSEKIKNIISDALVAGASVYECETECGKWSPTLITSYQNQDINQNLPIIKLLLCRTAKEGVALLNNCRYTLAISIWSEISSQALEISSKLISPNLWINCHGICAADVPFQLSGFSGNCVLGGSDGIMEYISLRSKPSLELNDLSENWQLNGDADCGKVRSLAVSAQQGFTTWQSNKDRRHYLKEIANSFTDNKDLDNIIQYYAHSQCIINFSDMNPSEEFFLVTKKIPLGVIVLLVNSDKVDKNSIVSLITPALTFGNAVIIVLKEDNPVIQSLIQNYIKILPKNVVSVIVGMQLGIHLISHPSIQGVWLYNESEVSSEFLLTVRKYSARNIKRFWIVPEKVPLFWHFFQKECSQNKVVWLPKIDEFP